MKTLTILRHAKSSWEYPDLSDIDRPIVTKGVKRTLRICTVLKEQGYLPDLVISSPAKRAHETALIIIEKLNVPLQNLQINKQFYPGYVKTYLTELGRIPQNINHIMIVGHNPGLTDLVSNLVNNESVGWIPTSGLVHIEFDCNEWSDIEIGHARLLNYLKPKQLKELNKL